ncbi:MAG: FAD-dependent oxidoreductase, partial [Hominilimicola sp.]
SPVHISSIENYISENYFDKLSFSGIEKNGLKAGIIGSGPAGITIAVILAQRGYDITIFESREKIGGVLRYGIPEFRLPKSILERYKEKLIELGIKIRPNTAIGTTISVDDMFRDGYSAIFIGTGVWKPNTLHIKGETLGNVHYAINYLTNPDVYRLGDTVNIIGAGNSAMDVARTALRHGAKKVTVFSRSDHLAASQREVDYAKIDGVEFVVHVEPVEIVDDGVIFVELECDGKGNLSPIRGTENLYQADSTIIAISQGPKDRIVSTTTGLEVNEKGLLVTNTFGETTRDGIFASGDVVRGAKTVVEAVAYSKQVADAMDDYMKGLMHERDL